MLQHPDLKNLYRPDNVLHFLAHQPDLDAYLSSIGTDALCTRDAKLIARSKRLARFGAQLCTPADLVSSLDKQPPAEKSSVEL